MFLLRLQKLSLQGVPLQPQVVARRLLLLTGVRGGPQQCMPGVGTWQVLSTA